MARNVVLVTIDSLRADHCGCYGYGRNTTPTLDAMADAGVRFEHAIAPGPKTPESVPVAFTGHPFAQTRYDLDALAWVDLVRPHLGRHGTVAEWFSRRGYHTIGFSPNGFTSGYFGFDRGFDTFEDFLADERRPGFELPGVVRGLFKWARHEGNWKRWGGYYDELRRTVTAAPEPYFLWVFLMDVHTPYLVPRAYRTQSWPGMVYANYRSAAAVESDRTRDRVVTAYDDAISYADAFLERARTDLPGDPAFVVTADHGEALGEHGHYGHEHHLYEENVHVPLVVGGVESSMTVDRPISLRALPSLLSTVAREAPLHGWAESGDSTPVVTISGEGGRLAVRTRRFKLLRGDETVLYDLSADAAEAVDVSADFPAIVDVLTAHGDAYLCHRREERVVAETVETLARQNRCRIRRGR